MATGGASNHNNLTTLLNKIINMTIFIIQMENYKVDKLGFIELKKKCYFMKALIMNEKIS